MDLNMENNQRKAKLAFKATKGFKTCVLVFFENSMAGVILNKKLVKEFDKEIKKKLKDNKISLLLREQARRDYWDNFAEKYAYMDIEELICLSNNNFEIMYDDIIRMRLSPFRKNVRVAGEVSDQQGEIMIKCEADKYHFNHYYMSETPKYAAIKDIFKQKSLIE